jgi:long-chain fatty acid transport protein
VAGSAAAARDASTVYYNPAGMARLPRRELVIGTGVGFPSSQFDNRDTRDATGALLVGNEDVDDEVAIVPSVFVVWPIGPRFRLGFGVTSPFGESTKYSPGWVGRYHTVEAELRTINLNPAVAYRLVDWLSVGVGFNAQYASVRSKNAIDFGSICFGVLPAAACAAGGLLPQAADGRVRLTAADWGFGFNGGVLIEPTPHTRIGVAYQSPIRHRFSGRADFRVPPSATILTTTGMFQDTDASFTLTLPERVSLSGVQHIGDRWTILADVTWTGWSRFHTTIVRFDNPAQPATVQPRNWHDTFRYALGASFRVIPELTLHAGLAYDESSVSDRFRTADIPVSARTTGAVGATYRVRDWVSLDFSYEYSHSARAPIHQSNAQAGTLSGDFQAESHAVGVQVTLRY